MRIVNDKIGYEVIGDLTPTLSIGDRAADREGDMRKVCSFGKHRSGLPLSVASQLLLPMLGNGEGAGG